MAASSKPQILSSTVRGTIDNFNEQAKQIADTHGKRCFEALHPIDVRFTEPAVFEFYFKTYREDLSVEIRKAFSNVLGSFLARVNAQQDDPVKAAQEQLDTLVLSQREHIELWIKEVCDRHQLSSEFSLEEIAEFSKWKQWRAPAWLLMQPVGTAAYDRSLAWEREEQPQTDAVLANLCDDKFMLLLKNTVRNVALAARLQLERVGVGNSPEPDEDKLGRLAQRGKMVEMFHQQLERMKNMYRGNAWSATQIRHKTKQECAVLWEWIDRIPDDRRAVFLDLTEWEDGDKFIYLQIATLFEHSGRFGRRRSWSTIRDWRKAYRAQLKKGNALAATS